MVSERALAEFFEALAKADQEKHAANRVAREQERLAVKAVLTKPASAKRRAREIEAARQSLRAEGIEV